MSITFGDLKKMILRALDDTQNEDLPQIGGSTYSPELLKDGVHAALRAITVRTWLRKITEIEANTELMELPTDLISVEGVYDGTLGNFLPQISFQIGNPLAAAGGNGWYLYPTGSISFTNKIGSAGGRLFYLAYFSSPERDIDMLESPDIAATCLIMFAASYCLYPTATSSADIRQFNTKQDAGQPGDIPAQKMSHFFLQRFETELQRIPLMPKGRTQ